MIIIISTLWVFYTSVCWLVLHRSLSVSVSPQVSRTFLSILADLRNTVVWMVSARPPISSSFSPVGGTSRVHQLQLISPLLSYSITFLFSGKVQVLVCAFVFFFLIFTLWSAVTIKSTISKVLFFCKWSLGLVFWSRLGDLLASQKSQRILVVSFFRTESGLCTYHSLVCSN